MSTPPPLTLATRIADLPAIGRQRAARFAALGLTSVIDLLNHVPFRYERRFAGRPIVEIMEDASRERERRIVASVRGEVTLARWVPGRRPRLEARIEDASGSMSAVWWNAPWIRDRVRPGIELTLNGRIESRGGVVRFVNPQVMIGAEEAGPGEKADDLVPVYRASELLPSARIADVIDGVLDDACALVVDHLPDSVRAARALLPLAEAYRQVHRPESADRAEDARRRLAYDELLLLQLAVMMKRHRRRSTAGALPLPWSTAIETRIRARLPFPLTAGQTAAAQEIGRDLAGAVPMNRLLQGDVGSGKTAVALCAMLQAVAAGHQAALMAPTEILAEQHHAGITDLLRESRVRTCLLTSQARAAERRETLGAIRSGDADIVIGTHALLGGQVEFRSLALVVVDEQHRFGVAQRLALRERPGEACVHPHMLVMTATPIPRTLALTVFGDLEVSTIPDRPPGRQPVTTRLVPERRIDEVWAFLARRLARGEQAFVVLPAIDEREGGVAAVSARLRVLSEGPLAGARLAPMHSRIPRAERESTMSAFRAGGIDVLVATTIIEVGIDIPRATVIVVEHADRFGLAQLHQLRGRVGRGDQPGVCLLIADPTTPDATARLDALVKTDDGFRIAEADLQIRGPGELFGARQSGLPPFRVADFARDLPLLSVARRDADAWIALDPTLSFPQHSAARTRMLDAYGSAFGLGDVG
ncbi:MAG: ATP-dependent DNA helicase RecG [Phycisphaeraceae bacterium]|nr:ATP-dependent DNA helicase RecG [Phycisphaeraceae bacterium]